jgi:type III pantothenate kinase
MNLVIDIGNTRSKVAIFKDCEVAALKIEEKLSQAIIAQILMDYPQIKRCIISSVTESHEEFAVFLGKQKLQVLVLEANTPLPYIHNYKTKETLGKDRIAAIAGACMLYPKKDVLVIDAGTAVTFDFKNKNEEYLGGTISPGLEMRFKALHHFTSKLPLLKSRESKTFMGNSTDEAIINGVQNGLIFEMEGYIGSLKNNYLDLIVLLTGGDAQFFDNKLKKPIFVVSNLVLTGLNAILEYNV